MGKTGGQDLGKSSAIEVEVERLPESGEHGFQGQSPPGGPGVGQVLGPVMAGFAIDLIDLATPVPLLGFALGLPLGIYLARSAGATPRVAIQLGLLAGLYCAVPMTAGLPIATLIGSAVKVGRAIR